MRYRYYAVLAVLAFMLASCTAVRIKTPEGTEITYIDWHPAGNAVDVDAELGELGSLELSRNTESSAEIAEAVVEAIKPSL
jgi:hypothetical protein